MRDGVREEVGLDRLNKRYAYSKPNFMNPRVRLLVGRSVGWWSVFMSVCRSVINLERSGSCTCYNHFKDRNKD